MYGRRLYPLLLNMKKASQSIAYTKRLAASALLAALSFVFMYIGTLTGVMDLCAVVVGALCCAFAVIELGSFWPWLVCAVSGVLCLLFLPDKFCALEYISLGGIYPILKYIFEKLPLWLSWVCKAVSLNVMLTLCLLIAKFVLGISDDWVAFNAVVYILANAFFVLFDYALTVFITYYTVKLRHRMKIRL